MIPARVFLVVWWFDRLGGMERHVTDLAIALARRGVAVTVFSEQPVAPANQYVRALRAADVPVVAPPRVVELVARIEHTRLYRLLSGRKFARSDGAGGKIDQHLSQALLLRAMARHASIAPPPLVHLHGCRLGQQAVLKWAAARGFPSVYTEHTTIADWDGPFDANAAWVVGSLTDVLACVSGHSRASLRTYLPWPREVQVVRHVVAAPQSAEPGDHSPAQPVQLLAVGRLAAHKGYATLLAAAAALQAEGLDFELRIAGDGEQRAELEAQRAALGLEDRVIFLGRVDQAGVVALWRDADIGVLPSLTEGLPLSLVEALAHGTPVVTTRVGGIPEAIRDGHNGLLVEPGDAAGLADALRRLIIDPALTRRLAVGARHSYAAGGWSEAAVTDHHLALYEAARQNRALRPGSAADAGRAWVTAQMRDMAAPFGRVALLAWRFARGTMEAALCRDALLLARAGVGVLLLVERPIDRFNPYIRRMRRAGVRILAPSPLASLRHRVATRLGAAGEPSHARASPLERAFAAECAARRPDVVHVYGWGFGAGWASLDPVLKQAGRLGIAAVYSEHANAQDCAIAAPSLRSVGALTASSIATADALEAATGRVVIREGRGGAERQAAPQAGGEPVVLTCQDANFAVALAEALADLRPVVIRGAAADLPVTDHVDCLMTGDDPGEALARLAASPSLAGQLAAGGRRTFETSGLRELARLAETIALYRAARSGAPGCGEYEESALNPRPKGEDLGSPRPTLGHVDARS